MAKPKHLYVYNEEKLGVLEREHHDKDLKLKAGDYVRMKSPVERIYFINKTDMIWEYDNDRVVHILHLQELPKDPFEDIV
jgi:hypothetical protein